MRALSGLNKMIGYSSSMLLLAVASLVIIPAMIRASGDEAWGAIAVGQSVGAIAAGAVAYGWSMSGPAEIARGSATERLTEFNESLKVRLVLLLPVCAAAALVGVVASPLRPDLAAVGALTAALAGLTANWFFVGLGRPYVFLIVETVPRVLGTVAGIVAMRYAGQDALWGLLLQVAGFLLAFVVSSAWILRRLRADGAEPLRVAPLTRLLRSHGDGLLSTLGSAGYVAAPVIIVSAVAPAVQPTYALVDKVQRQIYVGLGPFITVLQGWVPRARNPAGRARRALAIGAAFSILMGVAIIVAGRPLLGWLGAGALSPSFTAIVMMAVFVVLNFYAAVVARVVLATYGRLDAVARATLVSAVVGLPLVAVGARLWGAEGALAAVNLGLAVRLVWELVVAVRVLRTPGTSGPTMR